jgi:hypothetical protein
VQEVLVKSSSCWRAALVAFAIALSVLLLAACQSPTALPRVTEGLPTETAVPTTTGAVQSSPRATPSPAPTLPVRLIQPVEDLPGASIPVHYLPAPVCCLAADPFDLRVVYALLADGHFYVSPDRGQTWQPLPLPHPEVEFLEAPTSVGRAKIYVSAHQPGLVFVHSHDRLLRSLDRGQTWQEIALDVTAWTVNEGMDRLQVYAWRSGLNPDEHGLFRSEDRGETWEPMYAGYFPPALQAEGASRAQEGMLSLAADPGWEEFLYAGTNYGIFRSKNGGVSWEPFETGLPAMENEFRRVPQLLSGSLSGMYALTEAPAAAGGSEFLLARLAHGQVIPDQDSWELVGQGELATYTGQDQPGFYGVYGLEKDPQDEKVLFLATAGGLLASRDGGQDWRLLLAPPANRPVYRVEAAPGVPTRLYLSTAGGFASQPFEWPGPQPAQVRAPKPQYTPQVEFTVKAQHGGDLTIYAVDQTAGLDPGMAYTAIGPNLVLIDVSQETVPDVRGSIALEGELAKSIAVATGRAYVLSGERTLREIDVSDRSNPRQLAEISLPNPASSLALHAQTQTLLVSEQICSPDSCQGGLRLFSLAPGLRELVFLPTLAPVEQVEFVGDYVYAFEQGCRERACTAGLHVIDLVAKPLPRQVATLDLPGRVIDAAGAGDHLYVAHTRGLLALDISDAAHPYETNPLDLESLSTQTVTGMALSQGYAYLSSAFEIDIFSLQDPDRPRFVKTWQSESGYTIYDIFANQQALYAIEAFGEFGYCDSHLYVIDLSDPEVPRMVNDARSSLDFVCARQPLLVGERLYLGDWDGLHVLDLGDPFVLNPWSDYGVSGPVSGLVADQLRLFWSNSRASDSLYGMDVSDPEHVSLAGPLHSTWSGGMALYWNYLFVPAWADGLQVLDVFDYYSPITLKVLRSEEMGGNPRQAVLDGRYLYVVLEEGGLRILDVADPSRPRIIGRFDLTGFSFADLEVQGDYAYLLASSWEGEGSPGEILVLDVQDPAKPRQAGSLPPLEGEYPTSLAVSRGWLYLGGEACTQVTPSYTPCFGRFVSYRLADPKRPERAGQLDLPQGVRDIQLDGESGYLATGPAGVWAVDLHDPARLAFTGQQSIPSGAEALAVVNNRVYVAAGQGGLVVLDVVGK